MVPKRSSAVIQASGAAGTTVRRTPCGILPPWCCLKKSRAIAFGQGPRPGMVTTRSVLGGIDDDRRHAREVHVFGLHHAERDAAGDAGVDRIAARLQDPKAGLGREVLAGGHHVARPHDGRAMGLHAVLRWARRAAGVARRPCDADSAPEISMRWQSPARRISKPRRSCRSRLVATAPTAASLARPRTAR